MKIKCNLCGTWTGLVRESEIDVALITLRAHVDCGGHSEYRGVTNGEILLSQSHFEEERVKKKIS